MKRYILAGLAVLWLSAFMAVIFNDKTFATDARNFNAGRIIDDNIFTNSGSMSVQEIQTFLNSKVTCDTWGVKQSELGGGTRAQWMSAHGYSAPFRCANDYLENPQTGENNYGKGNTPQGAISVAQIIYNYSIQFNINPQVLIVTLQKENGLITDEWPTLKQYRESMGFGCPDNTAPGAPACDPQYGSFSTQIYEAARHFRGYLNNQPGWWITFNTGWNFINWNKIGSCGGDSVYIENRATVALYTYTPYQPNQAAKNAQYGPGDACSSYGNRNFFLYFTDWFGSTYGSVNVSSPLSVTSEFSQGLFTDNTVTARFTIKNNSSQRQDIGTLAIGVRDQNNTNFDFGAQNIVLSPWQSYEYVASRTFSPEGKYTFSIINYREAYGWSDSYPESIGNYPRVVSNATILNIPTVTTGIVSDISPLHKGQQTTLRFTVRNNSNLYAANLGYFGVAITSPTGKNSDLQFDTVSALSPGSTYDYYKTFTPTESGTYKSRISSTGDGGLTWSEARYPAAANAGSNRLDIVVKDSVTQTGGLSGNTSNLKAGDTFTGTFTVKNYATNSVRVDKNLCYILRSQTGRNFDLGCQSIGTLSANQEITFSAGRVLTESGTYSAYFSMFDGTYWHDNWSFEKETGTEATSLKINVKSNPSLTAGLSVSNIAPHAGDTVSGGFAIKNSSNNAVAVNKKLCYIVRSLSYRNYDLGCLDLGTLQPGEQKTFSGAKQLLEPGTYSAYFSMFDGTYWHDNWSFEKETGTEATSLKINVKSNPSLTQGLTTNGVTFNKNESISGQFTVKNNSTIATVVNKKLCYIMRSQTYRNYDLGCLDLGTLQPGEEKVFSGVKQLSESGTYSAYFSMFDGTYWHDNWSFEKETGTEATSLKINVL